MEHVEKQQPIKTHQKQIEHEYIETLWCILKERNLKIEKQKVKLDTYKEDIKEL